MQTILKRIQLIVALVVVTIAGSVAMQTTVHADSSAEMADCWYDTFTTGSTGTGYYAGPWEVTFSDSACEDVNVGAAFHNGYTARVRFCPTSGPCYANSWKAVCDLCIVQAATDVLNGTTYRVETQSSAYVKLWD